MVLVRTCGAWGPGVGWDVFLHWQRAGRQFLELGEGFFESKSAEMVGRGVRAEKGRGGGKSSGEYEKNGGGKKNCALVTNLGSHKA